MPFGRRMLLGMLAAGSLTAGSLAALAAVDSAATVKTLVGWWAGRGTATWDNGQVDKFQCRMTHRAEGGTRLKQTVRCNGNTKQFNNSGETVRIEVTADFKINGDTITGTWREQTFNEGGSIRGRFTDKGLELVAEHQWGNASVKAVIDGCKMTVVGFPSKHVKRLNASFRKSC